MNKNIIDKTEDFVTGYDFVREEELLRDKDTPFLLKRLIRSMPFLIVIFYISVGQQMMGLPLPSFIADSSLVLGVIQMFLAIIIMLIYKRFYVQGLKGVIKGHPNMDTLIALGSLAAFVYSIFMLPGSEKLLFNSAAIIPLIVTIGRLIEQRCKQRTKDAIYNLIDLAPKTAVVKDRYDKEKVIPVGKLKVGDVFIVRPGETVPADGIVVEGNSSINESALTGREISVYKTIGDNVSAATVNKSGYIKCRATRIGSDTTLAQIIRILCDATKTSAPLYEKLEKLSGIMVIVVIAMSVITFAVWMILGKDAGFAISRAIAVLMISCPCAASLAASAAIMVGNGNASKNGILFRNAAAMENLAKTQIVALEKTGTITRGDPIVTDIFTADSISRSGYSLINNSENELLKIAALLEKKSDHPLAKAVVSYVGDLNTYVDDIDNDEEEDDITDFEILPGHGLKGIYKGSEIVCASLKYISQICKIQPEVREKAIGLATQGKTPLCFAKDKKLIGIIAVLDPVKEDSAEAIKELKAMGIHVVMLTGDNQRTAMSIGDQAEVDEIASEVVRSDKEAVIRKLAEYGKVTAVGDGNKDASVLESADLGIAIGASSDVMMDSADIVLMKGSIRDVAGAIRLSKATLLNISHSLLFIFVYGVVGMLLSTGAVFVSYGWLIGPKLSAALMSVTGIFVVINALKLKLVDIYLNWNFRPLKETVKNEILTTEVMDEIRNSF
jgi:Cu2+-exporting ATPase